MLPGSTAASFSSAAALRALAATVQPLCARLMASDRPMPELAPVIQATLRGPSFRFGSLLLTNLSLTSLSIPLDYGA